jgi:hypothetical protein
VTTVAPTRAISAIRSSATGAKRISTFGCSPTSRSRPSSTSVTRSPCCDAQRSSSPARRRIAPGRSRHQPSGREPITFIPSTVLLLCLALAPAVGGCASGKVKEANDYVSAVNRAQTAFASQSGALLTRIKPGGGAASARPTLQRFYAAVDRFVSRLQAIKPPARVRALHQRLIAAMQTFGRSLRKAGAAIVSGNAVKILDGQQELAAATSSVSATLNRTVSAINAALRS